MTEERNGMTKQVDLGVLRVRTMFLHIEGESPLVVHRFGEKAKKQMRDKQGQKAGSSAKKVKRDPQAEFEGARYFVTNDDGERLDAFPSIGLKAAMIDSGYRYMGLVKQDLRGDIRIKPEYLEIIGPPPEMVEDVVRLAGVGRPADLRYRPYYFPWEMVVPVTYKPDRISEEQIVAMLAHAGFSAGLGENRPGKTGGNNGTFAVKAVAGD